MADAALTPRVRIMVVCDDVIASDLEDGVFTLEGVRQSLSASSFPWRARLCLFLLLSSARKGRFEGKALVINENDEESNTIRYVKFDVSFQADRELVPLVVEVEECDFPEPGRYSLQVWFSPKQGSDVLKGEQPFLIQQAED